MKYVKFSDMRGEFHTSQGPPPGKPKVYRRDLWAERTRRLSLANPQDSAD